MNESNTIILRAWSSETGHNEPTGETIDVYTLAKSLTIENLAALLDDFLNLGGKGFREGKEIGLQLRFTHRTLQRLAVCFAFGLDRRSLRAGVHRPAQRDRHPDR